MKRKLPMIIAGLVLTATIALVISLEPEPAAAQQAAIQRQPVSVVQVAPTPFTPQVMLTGTTAARWQSELKAQSSAEVKWLNQELEPGSLISKGTLLAKLDTTELLSQLALAQSELEQAKLQLQREQHEQTVALKMLNNSTSSNYARRKPQIAAAKAALTQAKSRLQSALKQLDDAQIRAPFDAIILSRSISPAQYVEQGQVLFTIAASESLDISVPVSERQWQNLSRALAQPEIKVFDRQGQSWPATVRYIQPQAADNTRQRQVVLAVNAPYHTAPRLLANQQVSVQVNLTPVKHAMRVPPSSLTRDGKVWCVNQRNQLVQEEVSIYQQSNDAIWLEFKHQPDQARLVALYPLLSMLAGLKVRPVDAAKEELL